MKAGIEQAGLVKHRKWKPRNFKKESKRWLKRAKEAKDAELLASEWSKDPVMRFLLAFSQFQEDLMKAHPDLVKEHPSWFEDFTPPEPRPPPRTPPNWLVPRPPPGPPPNWLGSPPTSRPAGGGSLEKRGTLLA